MYTYDSFDQAFIDERVAQFRDQTARFLAGTLSADAFKPLRLQNGLYIQRHAPMLRIAVPYGVLSAAQTRVLATVTRQFDQGIGHFSTRQNLQLNWVKLEETPDILAKLATVGLHAIQTSGNCIRNVTTDQFAGVAADELIDPRPTAELLRQWSTFHPEFAYLPRKFKIAITGASTDRAAVRAHDIGLLAVKNTQGALGFRVFVGGGLGRTPVIGPEIRDFIGELDLLTYLEAILRVYNRYGRRDNAYKARIKILVKETGIAAFTAEVESEYAAIQGSSQQLIQAEISRIRAHFVDPAYESLPNQSNDLARASQPGFAAWAKRNVHAHKKTGYAAVTISFKRRHQAPGDVTADELDACAALSEQFGFGELRITHEQNLVLPHVRQRDLPALHTALKALRLADANIGLATDIIACPGGDFCSLANAKSIPIAQGIRERMDDLLGGLDYEFDVGELAINISGCMNACGHHHIGHIGILGVDKNGEEWFQVSLGGQQGLNATLGKVIGPSFTAAAIPQVVEQLIATYLELRDSEEERFVDAVHRLGLEPFKARVYAPQSQPEVAHV